MKILELHLKDGESFTDYVIESAKGVSKQEAVNHLLIATIGLLMASQRELAAALDDVNLRVITLPEHAVIDGMPAEVKVSSQGQVLSLIHYPAKRWWQFWKRPKELKPGADYTVEGNAVTLKKTPAKGDEIVALYTSD